ncbi:ABC transporter substrate-binding protein [Salinibacterium sp. G-O1]|uniref:ABC transporter substrate-binding protein n=1 Tax=Salinibacterium sp. G-O1 TaxID=3046208 RepID=UPI0024BB8700|nr:ABC transporter substrate-binding protein [Salinibacterium sp. G-O1]MDJ0334001.1 ABC transporter substrate-binding protein [Salinibacterium sp. G-O1]
MRISRGGAIVAAVLAGALALTGCTSGNSTAPEASTAKTTLVVGKSFDLSTADPARSFETTGGIFGRAVYDTLLTFAKGDATTPIPMVAESYEANEGATEYTFTLRDDVVFSDGTPLTSADVVFSFDRVKNIQGNGSFLMEGLSVSAPDESTVVISSDEPNTAIPAIITAQTLGIVNSELVKENGGTDAADASTTDTAEEFLNTTSAGSGPYIIETFNTETETVIVANPNYWGEPAAYEKIVLKNATAENQLMDIQSGTIDIALDLGADQLPAIESNPELAIESGISPTIFFLFSNASPEISKVTSTQAFRDAVKYGLDYDGLLEIAGEGSAQVPGVIPSVFFGALKPGDAAVRDIDKAKAAVQELGDIDPISLEYPSDFSVAGISFGTVAERVQANLKEVGLEITLAPAPISTALDSYRAGTEQMGLWLWNPDYPDPADYLVFAPDKLVGLRAGWTGGSNPDLVALADKAAVATEEAERADIFREFQLTMNEVGVFAPLFQPAATVVAGKDIEGAVFSAVFGIDLTYIGK